MITLSIRTQAAVCNLGKLVARVEKKVASGQWLVAGKEGRGERGERRGIKGVVSIDKPEDAGRGLQSESLATSHWPLTTNPPAPGPRPLAPLFAVTTPTAVVTDLGTEFGVSVEKDGGTVTHVLEGRVKLEVSKENNAAEAVQLNAGESAKVSFGKSGLFSIVERGKADPSLFPIRPGTLAEYAEKSRMASFQRWRAFRKELLKRKDLANYYDFQPNDDNRMSLCDLISNDGKAGAINGAFWTQGRFPENTPCILTTKTAPSVCDSMESQIPRH